MTGPRPLAFYAFGSDDPLQAFSELNQGKYLRFYLTDLRAQAVVEEPQYFDRDYLSEFSAFYAMSSRGYPNTCRRLHFFAVPVDHDRLSLAAGGDQVALKELQDAYLGFAVIRPLGGAPFGRTVLKWYPESVAERPKRVTSPRREYVCHLLGIEFSVWGLAWQQQDSAVSACATVALWSVLHSSALDEWHSVPTTAQITMFANRTASLGARTFPTNGLTIGQVREAIKEAGLEPVFFQGDIKTNDEPSFSLERFSVTCAALIRSGFPGLLYALSRDGELHAVCVVGFRSSPEPSAPNDRVILADGNVQYVYLHDDNLGPSVRFELTEVEEGGITLLHLTPSAPEPLEPRQDGCEDPCRDYGYLRPAYLVAAVPSDLRVSADEIHKRALDFAGDSATFLEDIYEEDPPNVSAGTRFFYLTRYLGPELASILGDRPEVLARARFALTDEVAPMSRIVGVVRVGTAGQPLADVLFDTTEGDGHLTPFCTVVFSAVFLDLLTTAMEYDEWDGGVIVDATG